jgi:hypothetical protein
MKVEYGPICFFSLPLVLNKFIYHMDLIVMGATTRIDFVLFPKKKETYTRNSLIMNSLIIEKNLICISNPSLLKSLCFIKFFDIHKNAIKLFHFQYNYILFYDYSHQLNVKSGE